jgi:hypothetical protein
MESCAYASTIQIRDLDDDVYEALRRRASEVGLSVPEYLRREAGRLASRLSVEEWVERTRRRPAPPVGLDTVAALDELQGPWPG